MKSDGTLNSANTSREHQIPTPQLKPRPHTVANMADITKMADLLHGQEMQVHADADYTGVEKRSEMPALDPRLTGRSPASAAQSKR